MKKFILLLSIFLSLNVNSQNTIAFDNMETYDWSGLWFGNSYNSTWATNFSVSPTESAVIYGTGGGNSSIEQDWYVLPNITGLDPTSQYEFRFRLASYRVTSGNTTRGVDVADFVDIQVSYDGGISYTSELRITGNNNAYWDYNTSGVINHIADGNFTNSLAPVGDVYRSGSGNQQFTGPSVIILQLPAGITEVAIDILFRVNAAGEEWWLDNVELVEIPSTPLPITLVSFTGTQQPNSNLLEWKTASEQNNLHFILEHSTNGVFNEASAINIQQGAGNSQTPLTYSFVDNNPQPTINYYRLTQVDFNGEYEIFNIITIDNRSKSKAVKTINMMGQEVNENYKGVVIHIYSDGSIEKKLK